MEKLRRASAVLTCALFGALLLGFGLCTALLPKAELSAAERRRLQALPSFSAEALFDGSYFEKLTTYATDHFAARDTLRAVHTAVRTGVLGQNEIDGVFLLDGCLYAPPRALDTRAVAQNAARLSALAERYGTGDNVYWSVIPDKADFSGSTAPRLDTKALVAAFGADFPGRYIDIAGTLENADYYRTDVHWRQERLGDTANALLEGMGQPGGLTAESFARTEFEPFYGGLWGRYGAHLPGESLFYLTDDAVRAARVTNYERPAHTAVYTPEDMSPDPYDVFLSGAEALLEIESPRAETGRTLAVFRDSFSSSLAPWFLTRYEKIILVDLRYVASGALDDYVDLHDADDLLFLYSASILNTGGILK